MPDTRFKVSRALAATVISCAGLLSVIGSGDGFGDLVESDDDVDLSGRVQTEDGTALENVLIEAFLEDTVDIVQGSTSSDEAGAWSIVVPESEALTLRYSLVDYATQNTRFDSYSTNTSGQDIELVTAADAETIIDTAFEGLEFSLSDKAWLAIDVVDVGGNEVDGATVSVDPDEDGGGATFCDGTLTGSNITAAVPLCVPERDGPMVLFYFDASQSSVAITVSDISGSISAPLRLGQITSVTVQQPAEQ